MKKSVFVLFKSNSAFLSEKRKIGSFHVCILKDLEFLFLHTYQYISEGCGDEVSKYTSEVLFHCHST